MVQFTAPLVGSSCADCPATVSSGRPWKAVGAADGAASLRFDHSAKPGNIVEVVIGRNVPNHCTPRAPLAGEQVLCGRCQQARSKKVPDVVDLSLLFDALDVPASGVAWGGCASLRAPLCAGRCRRLGRKRLSPFSNSGPTPLRSDPNLEGPWLKA